MVGRVSVLDSRELQATIFAIKAVPTELRKQIRQQTRAVAGKEWTRALAERSLDLPTSRMLVQTARIAVSDQNIKVRSATSKRKALSRGAIPVLHGKAFEFGTNRDKVRTYQSRRGQTRFKVTRHTARQMPPVTRGGRVFYPAVAEMVPRILALWTQTTVRTIGEALEGRRG